MGDEFHAVDFEWRQTGIFFVKIEAGSRVVGLFGFIREADAHRAVFGGNHPFAGTFDAVHVFHKIDFLHIIGTLAFDMLADDGAADAITFFKY